MADGGGDVYTVHLEVRVEHVSGAAPSWDQVAERVAGAVRGRSMTMQVHETRGRMRLGTVIVRSVEIDTASEEDA
jgi:hypothetical protein